MDDKRRDKLAIGRTRWEPAIVRVATIGRQRMV